MKEKKTDQLIVNQAREKYNVVTRLKVAQPGCLIDSPL